MKQIYSVSSSKLIKRLLFYSQIRFNPSLFCIQTEHFGELDAGLGLFKNDCWINDSLILNKEEAISLALITKSLDGSLIYRASKDGFKALDFHSKCDYKSNTITIIKNNLNFIFGGYMAANRSNNASWIEDKNAFVFSLRKKGISNSKVFPVKSPQYAIDGSRGYGPIFGQDILIVDESNVQKGSYTHLGNKYNYEELEDPKNYLSGNWKNWVVTEIEVYEIKKYIK